MSAQSEVARKLKALRTEAGLSVQQVADALGKPKSTYAAYEDKFKKPHLPVALARHLADIFGEKGIDPARALDLAGISTTASNPQAAPKPSRMVAGANEFMQPLLPGDPRYHTGEQNLPILGRVKGGEKGEAFFIDQGEIAGFAMRPTVLHGVKDAYAVEFHDNSMDPAFKHGHLGWVHPHKTVKVGDDVVVQLLNGEALIKNLVRRTDKELVLQQYNPKREIRIARSEVKSIHLVVGGLRVAI